MKNRLSNRPRTKSIPVKTTFMELLEELSSITRDDALVLTAVKNIFRSYKVRLARTLAPVRLVNDATTERSLRRANLRRRSSAWA